MLQHPIYGLIFTIPNIPPDLADQVEVPELDEFLESEKTARIQVVRKSYATVD